jgi:hypothetical protein
MLQKVGPQPLIEPAKLTSDEDWIRAGKRVFDELDTIGFRTFDPKAIALARTVDVFARRSVKPPSDGTLDDLRWVPTSKGVALSLVNCKECHIRVEPDGNVIPGAPKNVPGSPLGVFGIGIWGASPLPLPGHTLNLSLWRAWAVPWVKDDIHESLKTMPPSEAGPIFGAAAQPGLFPRWHGSGFYPTKIPDLIGFKDRKYIDHTATHQHRGPGDLMRYGAMVTYSDLSDFGFRTAFSRTRSAACRSAFRTRHGTRWRAISTRWSRRRTRISPTRAFPRGARSSSGRAASTTIRRRSTPTTASRSRRASCRRPSTSRPSTSCACPSARIRDWP